MNHHELKYLVLNYFDLHPDQAEPYKNQLEYLKNAINFPEVVFPCESSRTALRVVDYEVGEESNGLKSVRIHSGINVFFPKEYSKEDAVNAMMLLVSEQSIESAHKYARVPQNTAVFDVGASEGFFSKLYCDETNEIYSFDEQMWMDANLATLNGMDASFIPGLVDSQTVLPFENTRLPLGCIKIDVEGMEVDVISCFRKLIEMYHPMIQVACYHYHDEADMIVEILRSLGYNKFGQVVPGATMLYPNDQNQRAPFFRQGVIIATCEQ